MFSSARCPKCGKMNGGMIGPDDGVYTVCKDGGTLGDLHMLAQIRPTRRAATVLFVKAVVVF
jgi:hypothetical protein